MHDLELARLIHADRERELAHDLRVRAFRAATRALDEDGTFVPPPADVPARIDHAIRLDPSLRRG
jgi:hypothetical protein